MLLIGTDEGIYRWTSGNNWPVFHGLQDRSVVGLAAPGAGILAALDDAGVVWESGDNGQNGSDLALPDGAGRPSALAVGGTPASILIAATGPTIYRRMLGRKVRAGSIVDFARQAGPIAVRRARAIVSRNRGGTATIAPPSVRTASLNDWSRLGAPKVVGGNAVKSIATIPGVWFASIAGEGLWRSTDDGANWSRSDGLPADVHVVRDVPGRPNELYAATVDGVKFSADSGATWEDRSKGLDAVKYVRALAVCPDEPNYLLAGAASGLNSSTSFGLFESKDAGKTWSKVVRSFPENAPGDAIVDILFDPADPSRAAVAFASGELWMTLNGGDYWQPFARDIRKVRVLCAVG